MHVSITAAVRVLTDCLFVMTVCAARLSCPLEVHTVIPLQTQFDYNSGILVT